MPYLGNVPSSFNIGTDNINNDAITTAKIADGAILNADVNAAAAIAGTKISPDFGSQNILTTGTATAASLIPTSSTAPTNGLYLPAANSVAISTGGSEQFRINANGDLLSGTTSALGYGGRVFNLKSGQGYAGIASLTTESRFFSTWDSSAIPMTFFQGGSERMRLDTSGRLGIGTSSPGSALAVAGDIRSQTVSGYGLTKFSFFHSGNEFGYTAVDTSVGAMYLNSSYNIALQPGGTTKAVFTTAGRLGVNMTNPALTLDVNGDVGNSGAVGNFYINTSGASSTPTYSWYGDADTGMFRAAANEIGFSTNASERARIDSSGRLLVGTSTAVSGGEPSNALFQVQGRNGGAGEEARIAFARGEGATAITNNEPIGTIYFCDNAGNTFADIRCSADATAGTNDYPGKILFSTTADGASSPTERLRISSNGQISASLSNSTVNANALLSLTRSYSVHPGKTSDYYGIYCELQSSGGNVNNTAAIFGLAVNDYCPGVTGKGGTTVGVGYGVQGWAVGNTDGYGSNYGVYSRLQQTGSTNGTLIGLGIDLPNYLGYSQYTSTGIRYNSDYTGSGTQTVLNVVRNNTTIGTITTSTTATAYNTSSDYRLKENVVPLVNAIPRLLQVPVHRFNFIASPDATVDGFIAHEVAPHVPEAVTGQKDEMQAVPVLDENGNPRVDEDGNAITEQKPLYQGIDQSKLVPLLTAALQEAIGEIESLKARVAALESA